MVEAKCIELIASKMGRDIDDNDYENKLKSLSKIMKRFQILSPIASIIRQNKTMKAVSIKYENVSSDSDILSALTDLIDPTNLINTVIMNDDDDIDIDDDDDDDDDYDVNSSSNAKMEMDDDNNESKKNHLLNDHLTNSSSYTGYGTPKKSLLSMASNRDFKKTYSPSLLSPVIQGVNPSTSQNERQVTASYGNYNNLSNSPSVKLRSRTAKLNSRSTSRLRSEMKTNM